MTVWREKRSGRKVLGLQRREGNGAVAERTSRLVDDVVLSLSEDIAQQSHHITEVLYHHYSTFSRLPTARAIDSIFVKKIVINLMVNIFFFF